MAVRVGDIRLRTLKRDDEADAHYNGADVGHDPVDLIFGCPTVDQEADWGEDAAD